MNYRFRFVVRALLLSSLALSTTAFDNADKEKEAVLMKSLTADIANAHEHSGAAKRADAVTTDEAGVRSLDPCADADDAIVTKHFTTTKGASCPDVKARGFCQHSRLGSMARHLCPTSCDVCKALTSKNAAGAAAADTEAANKLPHTRGKGRRAGRRAGKGRRRTGSNRSWTLAPSRHPTGLRGRPPEPGNLYCPSGFDMPGLQRHIEIDHGDICRNANYSGVLSGTSKDWTCPASCVRANTAPWCKKSASSPFPCRVPSAYLPKRCEDDRFYEVNYSPNWWDKSRCKGWTDEARGCQRRSETFTHINTALECAKKQWGTRKKHALSLAFRYSAAQKTCTFNPMDKVGDGDGDHVYCVRRQAVAFTRSKLRKFGMNLSRPTWMTSQRCSGSECVPCDKLEEGCFVSVGGKAYGLKVAAGNDLHYSSLTITLKCLAGDVINIEASILELVEGSVTIYVNGVAKFATSTITGEKERYDPTPGLSGIDGENEIMIVFARKNMLKKASAGLRLRVKTVRPDFSKCEDEKVCLGKRGLGAKWRSDQAKDLRQFIFLQYLCLNDQNRLEAHPQHGSYAAVCRKWADCLKKSTRFEIIKEIIEASGGSKAPQPPQLHTAKTTPPAAIPTTASPNKPSVGPALAPTTVLSGLLQSSSSRTITPTNANPVTCHNPFVLDVESWECACHEIMTDKCNVKGCGEGEDCFTTCYRAQLCGDPKVCQEWKAKVCCTDSEDDLNKALNGTKEHTCTGLRANCQHKEIGPLVQLHCPKTCGMCKLPYKVQTGVEADLLLDDALASKSTASSWTLTPVSPLWTHSPTDDQSCFVSPEAFDCDCYAKKRRFCGNEHSRGVHHLRHPSTDRVYSASECDHFFVCTHSQTCDSYKAMHCRQETKLLEHLQAKKHKIETC